MIDARMGYKLLILAAIGLGALYMMHILAQDYQKIRKPVMKLARALLTKRDLDAVMATTSNPELENFTVDWNRIITNDQLGCARSLICQVTAGAEKANQEAKIIDALIHFGLQTGAPKEIERAYGNGLKVGKSHEKCYKMYPHCPYSARTMLRILEIYSFVFG